MFSLLLVALVVLLLALGTVFAIRRRRTGTGPVEDAGSSQPGEARRDIRAYHRFSSGGGDAGLGWMDQGRR